jgi:hypothetical protein
LAALERTAPEVRLSLEELRPTYGAAVAAFSNARHRVVSWDDWGDIEYAVRSYRDDDDAKCLLTHLHSSMEAWADRWHLGGSHWSKEPAWMLDQATTYLEGSPKGSFVYGGDSYKEHLSRDERRFVIEEDVKLYVLKSLSKDEYEEYIEAKKAEWEAQFRVHHKQMRDRLDAIHGGPVIKKKPLHFDWLVLRHILGYSAETIIRAYKEVGDRMFDLGFKVPANLVPARQSLEGKGGALNGTAELLGLKLRRLRRGSRKSGEVEAEAEDIIRRLGLSTLPEAPACL